MHMQCDRWVNCIFNNCCKENNHARKSSFTFQKCQYSDVCDVSFERRQWGNEEWEMFEFIQKSLENNNNLTRRLLYNLNSQGQLNCFLKAQSSAMSGTRNHGWLNLLLRHVLIREMTSRDHVLSYSWTFVNPKLNRFLGFCRQVIKNFFLTRSF